MSYLVSVKSTPTHTCSRTYACAHTHTRTKTSGDVHACSQGYVVAPQRKRNTRWYGQTSAAVRNRQHVLLGNQEATLP